MAEFLRKRNRLSPEAYWGQRAFFVTVCTENRRKALEHPKLVAEILSILEETARKQSFEIHAYCFMPDHLHLTVIARQESCHLAAFIKRFKGASAAAARKRGVHNLWQKSFYDHVIRTDDGLAAVAWYIFNNPVRKGLARRIEEWPHSGSFVFDWKKMALPEQPFEPPWKKAGAGQSGM